MESIQNCIDFYRNNWLFITFGVVCITNLLTIVIAWSRIWWMRKLVDISDRLYGITELALNQEKQAHERTKQELNKLKTCS